VNRPDDALLILHGVASNKKIKVFQPAFEPLMLKHVELAVELKKGRLAKEALVQFKSISQNTNIEALQRVVQKFLELSEARVEQAREKSEKKAIDIEDLEAIETPESIMMSTVTDEDTKDRTDREILTPWLKFLWETYRTVLDVLRNNNKAEHLYQKTAQDAFRFCLKYQRKTEFRRLCEILRNHLSSLPKYAHQPNAISLNNPESLQLHFETRFSQLSTGTELELWQESFKTIEDIHGLMQMSKKAPKASAMADYYEKLTQIFLMSENYLMHAYAFRKFYTVDKKVHKGAAAASEDKKLLPSLVLLAALAVPVVSTTRGQYGFLDSQEQLARHLKLASLIGLPRLPTRDFLLKELVSKDLSDQLVPEVASLYRALEVDFNPMVLCQKVAPILTFLEGEPRFAVYVGALRDVLLTRLIQQLSEVYKTIKLKSVTDLVPFITPLAVERFIVEGCKRGDFQVRISHADQTLTFGASSLSAHSSDQALGGAHLQTVEIRSQVARLSKRLHEAVELVGQKTAARPTAEDRATEKAKIFADLSAELEKEHMLTLARRAIIEQRKVQTEQQLQEKERREKNERLLREREEAEAEKNRLSEDSKKREQEQTAKLRAEIDKEQKLRAARELQKKGEKLGIKIDIAELENLSTEAFVARQVQHLEKEKTEQKQRLTSLAKKLDHAERACRQEEIPLLEQDFERQKKVDREYHEKHYDQTVAAGKSKHLRDLELKTKLSKVVEDADKFRKVVLQRREGEHQKKVQEARVLLEAEKEKRREEYVRQWERDYHNKRADRERAEQDAQEKRAREEERRAREEERAAAEEASRPSKYTPPSARRTEGGAPEPSAAGWRTREEERASPASGAAAARPAEDPARSKYVPPSARGGAPEPSGGGWRTREEAARRDEGPIGARRGGDEPRRDEPRRDEPRRDDRRDEPRRDEGPFGARRGGDEPRREERRDDGPFGARRGGDEPRRDEPRRDEGPFGARRGGDEPRREERRDERREEPRREERREDGPARSAYRPPGARSDTGDRPSERPSPFGERRAGGGDGWTEVQKKKEQRN